MVLCNDECIPCCDYCTHVVHAITFYNGIKITAAPVSCSLHKDNEHKRIASGCGYCDDFHCKNAR